MKTFFLFIRMLLNFITFIIVAIIIGNADHYQLNSRLKVTLFIVCIAMLVNIFDWISTKDKDNG